MKFKFSIFLLLILISCSIPIKTITIPPFTDYSEKNHVKLKIFLPDEYVEYEYEIIAETLIENSFIDGDLVYDERAKRYLLEHMNSVGADALIINNDCSNLVQTCFYAIRYKKEDSPSTDYEEN